MSTVKDEAIKLRKNIDAVYEAGKTAEWNGFWDDFQQNGNKTNYRYAFFSWADDIYRPKYPIIISSQANDVFYYSNIIDTRVDISTTTGLSRFFSQCDNLVTIRKLIVTESVSYSADCFAKCTSLTNVTFEGVIGNTISFADSPLSVESMISIISCLKNIGDHSCTITFSPTCWDALEASDKTPYTELGDNALGATWSDHVVALGWNA